jgi:hypothetical protein
MLFGIIGQGGGSNARFARSAPSEPALRPKHAYGMIGTGAVATNDESRESGTWDAEGGIKIGRILKNFSVGFAPAAAVEFYGTSD